MATDLVRKIRGTRVRLGYELKGEWASASATDCESLIFTDLKSGDKFIAMPCPGDNSGHGGLLSGGHLFIKIYPVTTINEGPVSIICNAIRLIDGVPIYVSDDERVYLVQ